jgi:hypothetical protein
MELFIERTHFINRLMDSLSTRGVSHCGLAIYTKRYKEGKRRIMEIQIFHQAKI